MDKDFPNELFVVTTCFNKGSDFERDYVLDSREDIEDAKRRARDFVDWGWKGVRLRRVRFKSLLSFKRFEQRAGYDRYKIDDWQSDFHAY